MKESACGGRGDGVRLRVERAGEQLERVGPKQIVVVEEHDVLAAGALEARVRRRRRPSSLVAPQP